MPQIPPRCRITARLREQAGREVAPRGITRPRPPGTRGVSWPVAHQAFAAAADPVLERPPAPVTHPGIDEHRRGRPRWSLDERAGEYALLADRWHTCFFDLYANTSGSIGQVGGGGRSLSLSLHLYIAADL